MIYNVGGGGATSAENISYDNTESQLQAKNVQDGIDELNGNLTAENSQRFKFGYQDGKYGYWKKEADTDVFVPFKSGGTLINQRITSTSQEIVFEDDADFIGVSFSGNSGYGVYSYLYADDVLIKQGNQGTATSDAWNYYTQFDNTKHIKMVVNVGRAGGAINVDALYC